MNNLCFYFKNQQKKSKLNSEEANNKDKSRGK